MSSDDQFLRRAIRLAMNGRGAVEPNPMVGCVIVKNDRVIGEGFHNQFGQAHAEPNALANCQESPAGSTAYVTLEPCCHSNKKTPPCVPKLIAAGVSRVVVGCLDPHPAVNGNGIGQLRAAGIAVDPSAIENECRQLIAPFIARTRSAKPYITVKWAESLDGKVAGPGGQRLQISNPASSEKMQRLRSRSDAIMVGIQTAINDDPVLLPRNVPIRPGFKRIVLDRQARLPAGLKLVKTASENFPVIVCTNARPPADLQAAGIQFIATDAWRHDPDITHLLIDAGPRLASVMLPLADRLWVIRSPKIVGDETAPSAAVIPQGYVLTGEIDLDGDRLTEYLNTRADAFFAAVESADFVLSRRPD